MEALTIRKVRTFMGMDTQGHNCELLFNGKLAAQVVNDGSGGDTMFHWTTRDIEKEVMEYARNLPTPDWMKPSKDFPNGIEDKTGHTRLDVLISDMINQQDLDKRLKRICKKKTVFLLPGDNIDEGYRTLNVPWGDKAREYLAKKFPDAQVLNEKYA